MAVEFLLLGDIEAHLDGRRLELGHSRQVLAPADGVVIRRQRGGYSPWMRWRWTRTGSTGWSAKSRHAASCAGAGTTP